MKVKEVNLTANITWSPGDVSPIYLACGTAAQQLDPSFNSAAVLQIYDLNLGEFNLEMKSTASFNAPSRFHSLLWGKCGKGLGHSLGLLVGGCENNSIYVYDVSKLFAKKEPVVSSMENKHSGPVFTMDFNKHQSNLLASGSSDCEIFIWDLNDTSSPMTPGTKANLHSDVSCISWNRQVEHIMAATYSNCCVVFDLRKNSSIIQLTESITRIKARTVNWHPTVATQLILSADDDNLPVSQVWDLRFASTPLKTLESHQRGIFTSLWCSHDPDLYVTSGKDNRILVWNPNAVDKGSELVGEFPAYNRWSFDLAWCSRDPSLLATSSVDGSVSVYSLLGGGLPPSQTDKFSAIADSFPGMEIPAVVPQVAQTQPIHLKKPPRWILKPVGATFAFGGCLVSWNSASRGITISQVVTEAELVSRSTQLEEALSQQNLIAYCDAKAKAAIKREEQELWRFVSASFDPAASKQFITLLGYSEMDVAQKLRPQDFRANDDELVNKMSGLDTGSLCNSSLDPSEQFEMIASTHTFDKLNENQASKVDLAADFQANMELATGADAKSLIRHSLLVGDLESAVELCLKEGMKSHALVLASHAGQELFSETRDKVLMQEQTDGLSALIGSIVSQDLSAITSRCNLSDWKEALVAAFTYASSSEFPALAEKLGERLEAEDSDSSMNSAIVCYVCAGSLDKLVSCWTKTHPDVESVPSDLQDLVEILMVLQRALSSVGRPVRIDKGSIVGYYLCQYASLLAAQGALSTAVSYLNSATEGEMVSLRDRLYRSLGYQTASGGGSRSRTVSAASASSLPASYRCASTPYTSQPSQYNPVMQQQQQQQQQVTYSGGLVPQQPQMFSPAPPPQPVPPPSQPTFMPPSQPVPPPPYSTQPMGSAATAPSAPLQPGPAWPPSHQQMAVTSLPSASFTPPMGPPPVAGVGAHAGGLRRPGAINRYVAGHSQSASPSAMPASFNPGQSASYNPGGAIVPPPTTFSSPMANSVAYPDPLQQHQQASLGTAASKGQAGTTPAAFDPSVPRGWNDPPSFARKWELASYGSPSAQTVFGEHSGARRLQMLKNKNHDQVNPGSSEPVQPITAPVQGTIPAAQTPQQQPAFGGFSQGFQGFQQDSVYPSGNTPSMSETPPAAPIEKMPIPPEHQVIQEVLDGIRARGLMAVQNQVAKQRLEDLGPKIEILYDKLRRGELSQTTAENLHKIVAAVQSGDYHTALQLHTATITSGNFSEMSQFMPPLKMLLTTCMQCQVFLQ